MRAAFLIGFALVHGSGSQERPPLLETGLVREVELGGPPGTRVAHLRLDREPVREGAPPLGLARWVSGPDPRGGLRAELELEFLEAAVRVIHSERASSRERVLVFREIRGREGRTVFVKGSPADGYNGLELGGAAAVRHFRGESGELPLLLLEAACSGAGVPPSAQVFEPLSASFEETRCALGSPEVFELRRPDGSLRWQVELHEGAPVAMRWQESGTRARAITVEEYARLRSEHEAGAAERERERSRIVPAQALRSPSARER